MSYVSSACAAGQYGEHCSGQCLCQNGGSCDSETGQCSCPPGWTGAACELGEFRTKHSCPPVSFCSFQCQGKRPLYLFLRCNFHLWFPFVSLSRVWGRTSRRGLRSGLQLHQWREMWPGDRKMCVSAWLDRRALPVRWLPEPHISNNAYLAFVKFWWVHGVLSVICFSPVPLKCTQ